MCKWYHTIGDNEGEGWNLKILDMLKEVENFTFRGRTLLDLGSAEGGYVEAALDNGATHVTAFERDSEMVRRMRGWLENHAQRLRVYIDTGDLNSPSVQRGLEEHDIVFFLNLHHHLLQPGWFLQDVSKVVKDWIVTNGFVLDGGVKSSPAPTPERFRLSSSYVTELLEKEGFRVQNHGLYRTRRELIVGRRM